MSGAATHIRKEPILILEEGILIREEGFLVSSSKKIKLFNSFLMLVINRQNLRLQTVVIQN